MMEIFGSCIDEAFWSSTTNIIFMPTGELSYTSYPSVFGFFVSIKSLNFIMVYDYKFNDGRISTRMLEFNFLQRLLRNLPPSTNVNVMFPDKLNNMNSYLYKTAGQEQWPRLYRTNGKLHGYDLFFMDTVIQKQNARYSVRLFEKKPESSSEFALLMINSTFDLSLNTLNIGGLSYVRKYYKTINTFDIGGYCALIPIPPEHSFIKYILSPFDWMTWMFIGLSILGCAFIWTVFKSRSSGQSLSSPGHMVLRIIAGFFGQSISIRHTRWYHSLIVQIFAFMMIILGNGYQSLLISLLSLSRNGTRITTINEMMHGNYNFFADSLFMLMTL